MCHHERSARKRGFIDGVAVVLCHYLELAVLEASYWVVSTAVSHLHLGVHGAVAYGYELMSEVYAEDRALAA